MDFRNSGDSDSGGRFRGVILVVNFFSGVVLEVFVRGRSGIGLFLNEDDFGEVDFVCICKV